MGGPRNASPEVRAKAVLDLLEMAVRGQVPDDEDPTSDYAFMDGALSMLQADLPTLMAQASAGWSDQFGRVLNSAEALRCVEIEPDSKAPLRQREVQCDACGRFEKWCGFAIDLGGGEHDPKDWWRHNHFLEQKFDTFIERYQERGGINPNRCGLEKWDLGRFYLGRTCLRKAKLHFQVSMLIPEMMLNAWKCCGHLSWKEKATAPLQWATQAAADELLLLKEMLELCIADERRQDVPDLAEDAPYWERIDYGRNKAMDDEDAEDMLKERSGQTLDTADSGESEAEVQTERKKLTVFFSDIKDFTATTEEMEPEDMTYLLNDYLTKMTEIALEFGGTIDKYIGDAVMVFFGDPETKGIKQDALAAVRMAIAMQRRMVDLRAKWADMGFRFPFHIRCGINTGYCNVGNFGSEQRIDYTIIGGQVNLAARLEAICEPDGVTISHETYSLVRDEIEADPMEPIQVKGIKDPVEPFAIRDIFQDWKPDERYIRRDDILGLRLWVDLMRLDEERRQASIKELEEAVNILKSQRIDAADD